MSIDCSYLVASKPALYTTTLDLTLVPVTFLVMALVITLVTILRLGLGLALTKLDPLPTEADLVVVRVVWEQVEVNVVGLLGEQRLQVLHQAGEAGSRRWVLIPAVKHHIVDLA